MRNKLEVDIEFDFLLVGIYCHQMDYRLSWALNKHFRFEFKKKEDYRIKLSKGIEQSFSHYAYSDEIKKRTYHILSNKSDKGLLAKEYPGIDYFMLIEGYYDDIPQEVLLQDLKKVPFIITCQFLNPDEMISKMNFILE